MTDQNPTQPARILKIGATRIVADSSLSHLNPEQPALYNFKSTYFPDERDR
jgi:hypothetical protein